MNYISGDDNIKNNNMMSSRKRKRNNHNVSGNSRPKLDIQILHDTEAEWLSDPLGTEQKYIKEYEDCDSESSKLCLALIGMLKGNGQPPYTPEELLEECRNPLKHNVLAWKKQLLVDSLTTPMRKSYFDGKTFQENIDLNIVEKLLKSDVLRNNREDADDGCWEFIKMLKLTDEAKHLTKLRNNSGKTTYTAPSHGYGRRFPKNGLSLALLRKEIRHTLCKDNYIDFDMKNAHPEILYQVLKRCRPNDHHYWCFQRAYCEHREDKLQDVMKTHRVSRGDAKQLFICLINNGSYQSWKKDTEVTDSTKLPFVVSFGQEIKKVIPLLIKENTALYNAIKQQKDEEAKKYKKKASKNLDGSFMSIYLGNIERLLLEVTIKHLESKRLIVDNDCVLAYDGFMGLNNNMDGVDIPALLKDMQLHLKAQTGFDIVWDTKDMDKPYTEEDLTPYTFEHTDKFNKTYMNSLDGYERKKQYFELFHCTISRPYEHIIQYIEYDEDRFENTTQRCAFERVNTKLLKDRYCNVMSGKITKFGNPIPFVDEWLVDISRKEVDTEKYYPFNGMVDFKNRFMTGKDGSTYFNNFSGYSPHIRTDYTLEGKTKEESRDYWTQDFLDIVKENCNGGGDRSYMQPCFTWFIYLIAHMVQFPSKKLPFMPLFTGAQGTGKNFTLEVIALVIGTWNYLSVTNLESLYGEHADLWVGKILINLDELDEFGSRKYQGYIKKDVDNQNKKAVNVKFEKPRVEKTFALNVGTSNKPNPLRVDSDSGDRRFAYYVPGKKYKRKSGEFWDDMWKKMSNPQAIAALYDYLNTIDVSSYDFKSGRTNALTPRYYEWIGQNQSNESKLLAGLCYTYQERGCIILDLKKGFKQPSMKPLEAGGFNIDETITIDKNALFKYYQDKMNRSGQNYKTKPNFNAAIVNLGLCSVNSLRKCNGYPSWRFNIQSLLDELIDNGNVEAKMCRQ